MHTLQSANQISTRIKMRVVFLTFFTLSTLTTTLSLPLTEYGTQSHQFLTHQSLKHEEDAFRNETKQLFKRPRLHAQWPKTSLPKPVHIPNSNQFYDYNDEDSIRPTRHRLSDFHADIILDIKLDYCRQNATCENLTYQTCLGTKLPYSHTTLELTDLETQKEVQQRLFLYENLRHVPKCWGVIQPFLCALYMPKCENGQVDLPSLDMCNITRGPCKILHDTFFFPPLLRCENNPDMPLPNACKNDLKEIKFNTTGECLAPLIHTESQMSFYKGIDSCGLQCNDPFFNEAEHESMQHFVAWCASVCVLFNVFTIATFIIDWRTANRYPAIVIFYINICFVFICIGWQAQFYGGNSRRDIVCRKDHTVRMSEPSPDENLTCVIIFVMIYYFLIAALVWFVLLTYTWYLSFQALGKIHERIDKKSAYFHLAAWSFPLILTIITLATAQIDGDSLNGICFINRMNIAARGLFLLLPVFVATVVGLYFLIRGLLTLIHLKIGSKDVISPRANQKIRFTIVRMTIFTTTIVFICIITFYCHMYFFTNANKWKHELHEYILCRLVHSNLPKYCPVPDKPDLYLIKFQVFVLFLSGIVISSWIWTPGTIDSWMRFLRRKFDCENDEPVKLQKHKVIAQAFAKRKMLYNAGRLSLSFHDSHTDPVGLNFDLNSVKASKDLSSTWAAALPQFVNRRFALTGASRPTGSCSSNRGNGGGCTSMDSEVSFSVRRVSVESRRNSCDSQVSVQVSELKATRRKVVRDGRRSHRSRKSRHHRHGSHHARPGSRANTNNPATIFRKESSTSMESQLGTQLLTALGLDLNRHHDTKYATPNLKRRTANAGLETTQDFLLNEKLRMKLDMTSSDDDKSEEEEEKSQLNQQKMIDLIDCDMVNDGNVSDSSQTSEECPELKRLLAVQSSYNSGGSAGTQHKCKSVDVGVQADAHDIAIQTSSS